MGVSGLDSLYGGEKDLPAFVADVRTCFAGFSVLFGV
jgi:hypothetical protein